MNGQASASADAIARCLAATMFGVVLDAMAGR